MPTSADSDERKSGAGQGRICVVGGAGFIGRALVDLLRSRGSAVVIVDVALGERAGVRIDLTAPGASDALARTFEGVSHVVHLAARVNPATPAEREQMRRLHLGGTEAIVRAAAAAGVARIVLASSATVYGAWPDNPVPLTEDRPLRPNPGFFYGEDKVAQEHIVSTSGIEFAIARSAIVYGRGARSYLTEILRRAPALPSVDGCRPALQMVHIDDVVSALAALLDVRTSALAHGPAFNVGSADWLSFERVAHIARRPIVRVPQSLTFGFDALARVLPPHLRAPRAMLPYLMYPFVVDNARLRGLGWAPRHSAEQALRTIL